MSLPRTSHELNLNPLDTALAFARRQSKNVRVKNLAGESASPGENIRPVPADMPIPDRLNFVLVWIVFALAVALLWFASRLTPWWAVFAIGILFSYLLLTNYALLH